VRRAPDVVLAPNERNVLEQWAAAPGTTKRLAVRAQIVLEAAGGRTNGEIARLLGIHSETVARWRNRFVVNRVDGLQREAPRSGSRTQTSPALVAHILRMTLEQSPPAGTRWTTRSLGRALQVSHMRIHRVWRSHGLATRGLLAPQMSPLSLPSIDIAGLYLDAPAAAIVFSVERREGRADPDHPVTGVSSEISGGYLFSDSGTIPSTIASSLSGAEELVPRVANPRRSPHELLVFLRSIDESNPPDAQLHVILDRPLGFLSDRVGQWIAAHPRFRVYHTSPSESWTGSVDDWLRTWQGTQLAAESFQGATQLTEAIAHAGGDTAAVQRRFSWTRPTGLAGRAPKVTGRHPTEGLPNVPAPALDRPRPPPAGATPD